MPFEENDDQLDAGLEKARAFFQRAEEVAATDNFDYAIDMYLEGLRRAPDALEDGHAPLRRMALIRQGKGGKKPSAIEKLKRHGGKTPLDEMLNAEFLLAKDPDNLAYAEAMLKAAVAGGYHRTGEWIAKLVFDANSASAKPSLSTYLLLKDAYAEMGHFERAVAACQRAVELKPNDGPLLDELRNLSAQMTVARGKYGEEGDFRKSVRDREKQEMLHASDSLVKTIDYRARAVEEARRAYANKPNVPPVVFALVDALIGLETKAAFDEAMGVLKDAYERTRDFAFKRRSGDLLVRKLKGDIRKIKNALKQDPDNAELSAKLAQTVQTYEAAALEHFRECVENNPIDLKMKYEYAQCLLRNNRPDEAIPLFQEAQKDPRYKIAAMDKTGLCFFLKGWYADAIDIFEQAIQACEVQDSTLAKNLKYNLARSYEEDGQTQKALELFRKIAQLDFSFRDVRDRVDRLRNMTSQ
ncbi:MAG TPA: tetratricopeptide repeat protein [Anaerohalosphaeraceae bacterium]|mgnify:CR=1 FL=1|jgi:tetratricopeptide (TPR) repeat protein|nr:tetratricopeptide repeat protein [Anaerohalosphaeraceae bacterium]HRT50662.1 tetratricopeptide repeat protein [Anaerohalosphaeraceae bacterium]HRT86644.1 tetratricopeptide repeat protein [Anaerohalosphaeraceae bacterium]